MKTFISILLIIASYFFVAKMPMVCGTDKTIKVADSENLKSHVYNITNMPPRYWENPQLLDVTAEYIYKDFELYADTVEYQEFSVEGKKYKNVVAVFNPKNGEGKTNKDILVIGAHYDTDGMLSGADDNASGVAGLLEIARLLSKDKNKLIKPIHLVAFTLEEPPFFNSNNMGSYKYAEYLKNNNYSAEMISLEMIGYYSEEENSQDYPVSLLKIIYPSKGNFISIVGSFGDYGLSYRIKKNINPNNNNIGFQTLNSVKFTPGLTFSDHKNFWAMGYKAVMYTDTAFFRNKNYHTSKDKPETLDYKKMATAIDLLYGAIFKIYK